MKFLSFLFLIASTSFSWTTSTFVLTQYGTLQGWTGLSRSGSEYLAFTKIPFAKPPVRTLRFRNPVPFGSWEGILNATENLPHCIQPGRHDGTGPGIKYIGSEDCLYLSIYKPKETTEKLPILFYIHGGAFQAGHPGGKHMANFIMDENVILVATTYRLNLFGFLSLEDENIPGNFGLKDQAMALRWVKENIHSFGGDPERIVIFGESAGGASTHHLLLSPLTKDLISGAVSISGTIGPWSLGHSGELKNSSLEVVAGLECSGEPPDVLSCLQNAKLDQLVNILSRGKSKVGKIRFKPCVERDAPGALIPVNPITNPSLPKAPWIVSFTNGEYLLSYLGFTLGRKQSSEAQNLTSLVNELLVHKLMRYSQKQPSNWSSILKNIVELYFNEAEGMDIYRKLALICADCEFVHPTLDALHRQSGTKYFYTFEYRGERSPFDTAFSWKSTEKPMEAGHGDELVYLFLSPRINNSVMNEADRKISKEYIKLLTNFAYYQNPSPKGKPIEWKPWTKNEVLRITSAGVFVMGDPEFYAKFDKTYKMWKDILPIL